MGDYRIKKPENELQTREWFISKLPNFEYSVVESGTGFPDYILEDSNGKRIRAEVEFESGNFVQHGHDPAGCDMVICWTHTRALPLPVLELSARKLYSQDKPPSSESEDPVEADTLSVTEYLRKSLLDNVRGIWRPGHDVP